jgi:hypothetical protein
MQQQMMFLQQLLGRSGANWLSVTLLVGLLAALIFRPGAIHNLLLFRVAFWLLALSVIVSPLMSLFLSMFPMNFGGNVQYGFNSSSSVTEFLLGSVNVLAAAMEGASIVCGLLSLLPPTPRRSLAEPVKHPMD